MKLYKNILGVSGTLQELTKFEQDTIAKYNIKKKTFTLSVYGETKLRHSADTDVYALSNDNEWMLKIRQLIDKNVEKMRATLVFFEDDATVEKFVVSNYGKAISKCA